MNADEYDLVKKSSLKFKGDKAKKRKRKRALDQTGSSGNPDGSAKDHDDRLGDVEAHGGWWKAHKYEHIRDDVAIEFLPNCYARALSNGLIVLGNPHPPGEGPDEEEIFTAIPASTNHIALKSGYGRYLSVDTKKCITGLSEAVGEQQMFLPVFEEDNLALCAFNDLFITPQEGEDVRPIAATSSTAGPREMLTIRLNHDPLELERFSRTHPKVSGQNVQVYTEELSYARKHNAPNDKSLAQQLKKARREGDLHEALLDSRVKKKSDKYCK